jgi:2-polyprenyl-6-methoxyphenol hydroxylase-like FAD-dependent oxidoreductase
MKVGINGIGVAGPTLAYWLRKFGHEPVLFEKAPALRTGGYLIDFWGLGYEVAERMGLVPQLREQCYLMERLRMVDEDNREVANMDITPAREHLKGRFISLARSDLSAILVRACDGIPTHFGVSVAELEQQDNGILAHLTNGQIDHFDLIVGADGLHSHVRALAFGPELRFEKYLGCHVAAFRLSGYPRRDGLTYISYTAPKRHVARVTLRNDETLVLLIWRSELNHGDPPPEQQKAALRRIFGDMKWEVPEILERMDEVEDVYFDRVSQIHLPRWSEGRVALLGDAAACASLLAGEGTGLAMIEAYVLAGEIHRAGSDLARGLAAYEARLRSFVQAKQRAAVRFRGFFAPQSALGLRVRNALVNLLSAPVLGKRLLGRAVGDDLALPEYAPS